MVLAKSYEDMMAEQARREKERQWRDRVFGYLVFASIVAFGVVVGFAFKHTSLEPLDRFMLTFAITLLAAPAIRRYVLWNRF